MARVMLVNWWSKTARVVECDPAEAREAVSWDEMHDAWELGEQDAAEVAKANGLTLEAPCPGK